MFYSQTKFIEIKENEKSDFFRITNVTLFAQILNRLPRLLKTKIFSYIVYWYFFTASFWNVISEEINWCLIENSKYKKRTWFQIQVMFY